MLYKLLLFTSILGFSAAQDLVTVTVYYEALCPYSTMFIKNQLVPSYPKVADYISVELVPYGNARHVQVNGEWQFTCQHGEKECHGNMMQACGLTQTTDQAVQVSFVNCAMTSPDPSADSYVKQCAEDNNLSWSGILSCINDGTGSKLLAELGDKTHAVKELRGVPAVIYNNVYSKELLEQSYTDFLGAVCSVIGNNVC